MPPFGVCIKLKTTCEGYVSSPFLLPEYRKYASNPLLAFRLSREKVGLSTAPKHRSLYLKPVSQSATVVLQNCDDEVMKRSC